MVEHTRGSGGRARSVWLGIRSLGAFGLGLGVATYLVAGVVTMFARGAEWRPVPMVVGVIALGVAALSVVLWLAGAVVAWWLLGPSRWTAFSPRARRERLLAAYDRAASTAVSSGLHLIRVRRVYQRARRGTKAVVEHADGTRSDAWFWWSAPNAGHVLLVRGHVGPGTQHSSSVLYIGSLSGERGVVGGVPSAAWRANRRRARTARRSG